MLLNDITNVSVSRRPSPMKAEVKNGDWTRIAPESNFITRDDDEPTTGILDGSRLTKSNTTAIIGSDSEIENEHLAAEISILDVTLPYSGDSLDDINHTIRPVYECSKVASPLRESYRHNNRADLIDIAESPVQENRRINAIEVVSLGSSRKSKSAKISHRVINRPSSASIGICGRLSKVNGPLDNWLLKKNGKMCNRIVRQKHMDTGLENKAKKDLCSSNNSSKLTPVPSLSKTYAIMADENAQGAARRPLFAQHAYDMHNLLSSSMWLNSGLSPLEANLPLVSRFDSNGKVVRKKVDRRLLHGFECECCKQYYDALGLETKERQRRIDEVSKHRGEMAEPGTPEHYWEVKMADKEEQRRRGQIIESNSPIAAKPRNVQYQTKSARRRLFS